MELRERLGTLLRERSLFRGEFTLASGRRSTWYVDARRTTLTAEGQYLVGRVGLASIEARGWGVSHVGGLTMGADPVAYAIAHASWVAGRPRDAFTVRKSSKEHGTGQRIEGGLPSDARCVVVEDSTTTGGSALEAVRAVREHGAEVVGVLTLVDRQEGAEERILGEAGVPLVALFTAADLLETRTPV